MSSLSPTCELEKQYVFTIALTIYSSLKKNMKGKAPASKEAKFIKLRELFFLWWDDNYLAFLQSILKKHGQDQYKLSGCKCYSFKFALLKAKGQHTISDMH
ncbi:hypothetical protein BKA83DRAFT_4491237 [Pisolithus microcarpus]|nr:hypothetical protein BKA83DRAFT_4491237 [Pisolithus microcarpus]